MTKYEKAIAEALETSGRPETWISVTRCQIAADVYRADEAEPTLLAGALMSEAISEGLDAHYRELVIKALAGPNPQNRREYLGAVFEGLLTSYITQLAAKQAGEAA